jgi:hypothetical protein
VHASSLAEGPNAILVCVTDAQSHTNSAVVRVTKDTVAPSVAIDSVSPKVLGATGSSTITWHANESGAFTVRIGGCASGTQVSSGTYTAPNSTTTNVDASSLANGSNSLRVCVTDAAANTGSASTTITKDTTPPTVTVDSVSSTLLGKSGSSVVTWHASENGTFSVRVGGSGCADGTVVASGSYSGAPATHKTTVKSSSLAEGSNPIVVCVVDKAGNGGTAATAIVKDTTPPVVTIDGVSPTVVGATGSTTLTWHAGESGPFSVRVGGSSCSTGTAVATGAYTAPGTTTTTVDGSSLASGKNTIRVCVTDAAGNTGSKTATVKRT